jgi:hypothetical protein
MSLTSPDTAPEAARALAAGLRRQSPARKLAMVGQLHRTARLLAESGLRRRHPEWSPEQLQRGLARKMLGAEAFRQYAAAVGWDEP